MSKDAVWPPMQSGAPCSLEDVADDRTIGEHVVVSSLATADEVIE
jgi:hypothetical protein